MKLKNKKTGEIVDLSEGFIKDTYCGEKIMIKPIAISNKEGYVYNSLAELNSEWEDYEEPKYFYCISTDGSINKYEVERYAHDSWCINGAKIIGNYFSSREEAEKAVEKLKAWKRLKDKGYKLGMDLSGVYGTTMVYGIKITASEYDEVDDETRADLDLLFGGEE